jgi:hypothetical protein
MTANEIFTMVQEEEFEDFLLGYLEKNFKKYNKGDIYYNFTHRINGYCLEVGVKETNTHISFLNDYKNDFVDRTAVINGKRSRHLFYISSLENLFTEYKKNETHAKEAQS